MATQQTVTPEGYQRLSVNINAESAEILRAYADSRGITATEAVRRAIGVLGFFHEAIAAGSKVLVEDRDGNLSIVTLRC